MCNPLHIVSYKNMLNQCYEYRFGLSIGMECFGTGSIPAHFSVPFQNYCKYIYIISYLITYKKKNYIFNTFIKLVILELIRSFT